MSATPDLPHSRSRNAARLAGVAIATAATLAALLFAARSVVDVPAYLARAALGTSAFAVLWWLGWRFPTAARAGMTALLRLPIPAWAVLVAAAALAAEARVFDGIPHTSDEAAYQFQARALAQGRLGFEPPVPLEPFTFVHLSAAGGVWHGIMNPGWPALLAPAMRLGVPRLANPLLAAATLVLLHGALRRGLGARAARLCALGVAVSPFFVFQAATAMSHTSNLFVFALFLYAWARQDQAAREGRRALGWALLAGLALGIGATIRPLDTAAAAAPFGLWQLRCALAEPRRLPALLATGTVAAAGAATLLAYNAALTGDPRVFPQEVHFERLNPGHRFGFGFGPDMGTPAHGPEWPGYFPSDAPRVTAHRLLVGLEDVFGLPVVVLAGWIAFARPRRDGPWAVSLAASALSLVAVYVGHFYHGIAYGSRHYALALPGAVALLALPTARALAEGGTVARAARAAVLATLACVLLVTTPRLVALYAADYRQASGAVREASRAAQLHHALVFVHSDRWGWKSAFPLNDYPLERNDVLYARDRGTRNLEVRLRYPTRVAYRARFGADGRVRLQPLPRLPTASRNLESNLEEDHK